ncbi:MAG: preprotein translocase subunit SecY [Candidatus Diapherotrites archaeon]|uniref:Preprotein translocase subunit SecY n=1 Tax=Candidatus Iainarchaeum sp. TaxID=3101447 RepID=A0A938YWZ5_9ARCH|nr:preprotein translocase subunit SecY [Candidatus Diapherotrites archaeon]
MSLLDTLEPVFRLLPEIKPPETAPPLKKKLMWSAIALLLFFIMGRISIIGLDSARAGYLSEIQTILASQMGSIISAGIGPIVLSSIILQLLVGAKFLDIDLGNPRDRARFQSLQKLFSIILCFFEAAAYTITGTPLLAMPGMMALVVLQVAFGSIILLYLDEIVSKYGIGSGIGLFIAGGVSGVFFWRVFRPGITIGDPGGVILQFIGSLSTGANFLLLLPILVAAAIFAIVVFAEGMHINIPITMGTRGMGGRFPVKLLYVSNLPVILAVALFANLQLWAEIMKGIPIINQVMATIAWATNSPFNLFQDILVRITQEGFFPAMAFMGPQIFQAFTYMIVLIICCIIFGIFWVQMGGQSPSAVADQLQRSGMYIPGFRRDKRIIEGILNRYIPTITILGSIFVALLAGLGDMALSGLSSGTGILLTVGIVYRLYEELAKEQMMAMHPLLGKLFG